MKKKGGIQICHVHVELHQESFDIRTNTKSSNGGVFEEANVVHYALHELGLCWNIRGSQMYVRRYNFPI